MSYLMSNYKKEDIVFIEGKNSVLIDKNGKDYIDFAAGIGVCSLGHANDKILKTINKQSKKILHTSNLYKNETQEKLAKKISKLLGYKTYAFFCNSGAEANECAIKLAREYGTKNFKEKKYEILSLKNSFSPYTLKYLRPIQ